MTINHHIFYLSKGNSEDRSYSGQEIAQFVSYGLKRFKDPKDFKAAYKQDGKKLYEEFLEYSAKQQEKTESKKDDESEFL